MISGMGSVILTEINCPAKHSGLYSFVDDGKPVQSLKIWINA